MNQGNFQPMSGQPMPLQVVPQPNVAPTANGGQVQQLILRTLSQQPTPQGWQSSVQTQLRANIVFQIFSQIRLLQSHLDLQYVLNLAMGFEGKAFAASPDRNIYEQECKRKMEEIHQMRAKQSAGMQQQINQQMNMPQPMQTMAQAMAQGQGQYQQGPPHTQPQQMMQNQGMPMQQQQSQQPGRQQQPMAMGQRPTNMPHGQPSATQQMAQQHNQYTPTPEENAYISRIAHQMFQSTPPQRLDAIQNNLRTMSAEQRESISRQGLDPMAFFFRTQAMKRFMEMKRVQVGAQGGSAPQSSAMPNGMSRPSQNTGRPSGQQGSGQQQSFEPAFDQYIGQQQDGLRSQADGQVVVPASNSQANLDQRNAARANAQQQMNMQNGGNRSLQNTNSSQQPSQPFWGSQQGQRNMNAGAGVNGNNPAANFPTGNQPPSNLLQGQPGGLDNQITRTPSQTPGMPNLNKAAAPPGQAPSLWAQRTAQNGQVKPPGASLGPQAMQQSTERPDGVQQRPPMIQNMPAHMQQQLLSMPEEQRRGLLMSIQRRQMAQQQQQQQQQQGQQTSQQAGKVAGARASMNDSFPMSSQASQPGMQTGPIAAMPSQTMVGGQSMVQGGNSLQTPFPQQPPTFGNLSRQQPASSQPTPQQRGTPQHPGPMANPPPPLTKEQVRQMDQKVFPAEMLSRQSQLAQLPKDVKTWGQLKDYVAKHASALPAATLAKLEHLQAIQFRSQQQEPRTSQLGNVPVGAPQPQAPFAKMVSQPNVQAPVAAPRPTPNINIPPPTFEEIQAMRARLPPHLKGASDAQVSEFVMRQKQTAIANRIQAQQAQNLQTANGQSMGQAGLQGQIQGPTGPSDVNLHQQTSQAKSPGQQAQKGPNQAGKQGQASRSAPANKQSQKNAKRASNDDVIEVSNPNAATSQGGNHGQTSSSTIKQNHTPSTQVEKAYSNDVTSSNQKNLGSNQPQNTETQNARPPGLLGISKEEGDRRDARLKQLMIEVGQNQPPRRPVPVPLQIKLQMAQKLREFGPMIQRMESSLPQFFRSNPDEGVAKQLIQIRQIIKAQYRDAQFNLVDHFTISPNELDDASSKIRQYFVYVMRTFGKRPNNASQFGEQQQSQRQTQQPPANPEKAQLSAANLKEQQEILQAERALAMQKHHPNHGSRVPPAPTSEKPPPFPLGPQSPHGIPHAYGPTTLTADQLVLPQPKRRKSNNHQPSTGSTPLPAHDAKSSPFAAKLASPELQKTAIPLMSFKCGASNCQSGQHGFATQAELEKHNADEHEPKEPIIEDPVEFALESMRAALGLDENGKSKPQKDLLEAPKMKASLSAQSHTAIKQEASTPMSRAATQTSNPLKTPQPLSSTRSPATDAGSTIQGGKSKTGKEADPLPKETVTPPTFDPWAGSSVSPDDITSAWSSLADMQSMSFTKIQMGLTPSSTLSSSNDKSEKNSPRPSDISENDAVKINIEVGNEDKDSWIPGEWFEDSLYGDIESLNFGQDPFIHDNLTGDMDWDLFGDFSDTVMVDADATGLSSGKGKRKDEEDVVSTEFLKMYAPEKLVTKKAR